MAQTASTAFSATVLANHPPVVAGVPASFNVTQGDPLNFAPYVTDPDGDTPIFSIEPSPAWPAGSTITLGGLSTIGAAGSYSALKVKVIDGRGGVAFITFDLVVAAPPANLPTWKTGAGAMPVSLPFFFGQEGSYYIPQHINNWDETKWCIQLALTQPDLKKGLDIRLDGTVTYNGTAPIDGSAPLYVITDRVQILGAPGQPGTRTNLGGLIKLITFDTDADRGTIGQSSIGHGSGVFNNNIALPNIAPNVPTIDLTVSAEPTGGSLKFIIPSQSGAGGSGQYFSRLADDNSIQIGENESIFWQWRERFSDKFLATLFFSNQNATGTVQGGSTFTSINAAGALIPAPTSTNQYVNQYVVFARDTLTPALRNVSVLVSASSIAGVITAAWPLAIAPAPGDTFAIGNAAGGWKLGDLASADGAGCVPGSLSPPCASSCTPLELIVQNTNQRGFVQLYHSCLGSTGFQFVFEESISGGSDFKLQNARPAPFCLYSKTHTNPPTALPPGGGCLGFVPFEFLEYQLGVNLGSVGPSTGIGWGGIPSLGFASANRSKQVNLGDTMVPTAPNGLRYICTTAGVTGPGEPAWGGSGSPPITDGAAVWSVNIFTFWGQPSYRNSLVRLWQGRVGQPAEMTHSFRVDLSCQSLSNPVKYGKIWLLPYHTSKDPAQVHDEGYVWYDSVIAARHQIASPA
jgi:hypothetical protein